MFTVCIASILSVMLMVELDFDDVTDFVVVKYFSLISLSIFCLVNIKLLLPLPTCAFDIPSKSRLRYYFSQSFC